MMWILESNNTARRGWTLIGTTHDPQNGSTHRSKPTDCASRAMLPTSLVLIPWHFSGGTKGASVMILPPLWRRLLHPTVLFRPHAFQGHPSHAFCILRK